MPEPEPRNNHTLDSISSDADLQEFLESRIREHYPHSNYDPAQLYCTMRNYQVEPLDPVVAVFLIERAGIDSTAHVVDEYTICCLAPLKKEPLTKLQNKVVEWGYDVVGVCRADVQSEFVPVVELSIQKSPSIQEEFRMLSVVSPDVAALLDGWATVVYNRHRPENTRITVKEWASIRHTSPETVRENTHRLAEALREIGGIPGTQWEISERGGISLTPLFQSHGEFRHWY